MNLDHGAPKAEQDKVFAAMKTYPAVYISVNSFGFASIIDQGQPRMHPTPLDQVLILAGLSDVQTAVLWHASGKWFELPV